ncbi:PTS sugar transporter subunit IIA [Ktedonospora formicarum]|uniref:PTS sugar transporter n=1 Tax=Ktedonospora formicarum TaxID=2778364 RepID=A0A8J3HX95_9CHLR|nr:PTS sugar transporter subunit IIA [Ktedonospora formicarum]GHO42750.1 PTS sugar transporter [Ktedonospora formicarum]
MIGIILVSHGSLAKGLKDAAEMIVGPQERLVALGMAPQADLAVLRDEIQIAIQQVGDLGGALILVDILGGSPANAGLHLANDKTQVICGTNLPMLLEILTLRANSTIEELASIAVQTAREGIIHLKPQKSE